MKLDELSRLCTHVVDVANVRFYAYHDEYIIVEDTATMTPMLISLKKGKLPYSVKMFKELRDLCKSIFGDFFTLIMCRVGGLPAIISRRISREQEQKGAGNITLPAPKTIEKVG